MRVTHRRIGTSEDGLAVMAPICDWCADLIEDGIPLLDCQGHWWHTFCADAFRDQRGASFALLSDFGRDDRPGQPIDWEGRDRFEND